MSGRLYYDVTTKSLNKKGEELCGDKVEIVRTDEDVQDHCHHDESRCHLGGYGGYYYPYPAGL